MLRTREIPFAGYTFTLEEEGDLDLNADPTSVALDNQWFEYLSRLVRHTYGGDLDMKQAVLDALSPFQLVSKSWAASAVNLVGLSCSPPRTLLTFVGSWFGQLPMLCCCRNDRPIGYDSMPKVLIDKDAKTMWIAEDCTKFAFGNFDYFPFDVFEEPVPMSENQLIAWTGIEHFQKLYVDTFINTAKVMPTIWVLQGTDRVEYDHINPVTSFNDLEQYFHDGTILYRGKLSEPTLGNRYMIVCAQ